MRSLLLLLLLGLSVSSEQTPAKSAIEGTIVRKDTSEPIPGAQVTVTLRPTGGVGTVAPLSSSLTVTTDASGRFSVPGLEPSGYQLAASADGYVREEYGATSPSDRGVIIQLKAGQSMNVIVGLIPGGVVSGRVNDEFNRSIGGIRVALSRLTYRATGEKIVQDVVTATTNDRGEYRLFWITPGRYYLQAGSLEGPANALVEIATGQRNPNRSDQLYRRTYFPGTSELRDASPVDVLAGSELAGFDFRLGTQRVHTIRGRLVDPNGRRPATANITLINADGATFSAGITYDPTNGTLVIPKVTAGSYILSVQVQSQAPSESLRASAALTMADSDIDLGVLVLHAPVSVPGNLRIDGRQLSDIPGFERLTVILNPTNRSLSRATQSKGLTSDGSFQLDNVVPGTYWILFCLGTQPCAFRNDYYIKEARFNSIDIRNMPLNVSATGNSRLDIVLSPNVGEVTGTVLTERGIPAPATQVVLVPDANREQFNLYRTALSDQGGKFSMQGVPPGSYKAFAWDRLEEYAYFDTDVIRRFETVGKQVVVHESGRVAMDLRLIVVPK